MPDVHGAAQTTSKGAKEDDMTTVTDEDRKCRFRLSRRMPLVSMPDSEKGEWDEIIASHREAAEQRVRDEAKGLREAAGNVVAAALSVLHEGDLRGPWRPMPHAGYADLCAALRALRSALENGK